MTETVDQVQDQTTCRSSVLDALVDTARTVTARSDHRGIVVLRHPGTDGVRQAVALSRRLSACDLPAEVIVPAEVAQLLHAHSASLAAVIDLDSVDPWAGAQLAAEFGVPLIVPSREGAPTGQGQPRTCDAMSLAVPGDNGMAAWQTEILPRPAASSSLTVEIAHRVIQVRDTAVRVRVHPPDGLLELTAGPRSARYRVHATQVRVDAVDGAFDVVRDGALRAPLSGPLVVQSWRRSVETVVAGTCES